MAFATIANTALRASIASSACRSSTATPPKTFKAPMFVNHVIVTRLEPSMMEFAIQFLILKAREKPVLATAKSMSRGVVVTFAEKAIGT